MTREAIEKRKNRLQLEIAAAEDALKQNLSADFLMEVIEDNGKMIAAGLLTIGGRMIVDHLVEKGKENVANADNDNDDFKRKVVDITVDLIHDYLATSKN